jgi:uncharacterized OsmC-like protein
MFHIIRSEDALAAQTSRRVLYAMSPRDTRVANGASTIDCDPSDPFHAAVLVGSGDAEIVPVAADRFVGGTGDGASPGDLFCAALAASIDSALRISASVHGVPIRALSVDVRGWLDPRGALGDAHAGAAGFHSMVCTVRLEVGHDVDAARLRAALADGERTATVLATLRPVVPCHIGYEISRRAAAALPHRLAA